MLTSHYWSIVTTCHGLNVSETRIVYLLHGEKSSSTPFVHWNGKQKYLMVSSIRIDHLLFTHKNPLIYRKRLGRVRPLRWRRNVVSTFSTGIFWLEIWHHPARDSANFESYPVSGAKIVLPFQTEPSGILREMVNALDDLTNLINAHVLLPNNSVFVCTKNNKCVKELAEIR